MSHDLSVLVLAAGLGTRLKPYTDTIPKPLAPVVDKSILAHQLDSIHALGQQTTVTHIGANAHYLADQVEAEALALGFHKVFKEVPEILGTGGPLNRLYEYGWKGELLVMNSDNFHDFDLARFVFAARESGAPFALLCMDFGPANNLECNPQGFICGRDGKYSVGDFVRKVAFSGIAWYSPEMLARIELSDFNVVDFWMREAKRGVLPLAYLEQEDRTWIDMGSPSGFYRASQARLAKMQLTSWVAPTVSLENTNIGPGTIVCGSSSIGKSCSFDHCIILPGTSIPAHQVIQNRIVGKGFQWEL